MGLFSASIRFVALASFAAAIFSIVPHEVAAADAVVRDGLPLKVANRKIIILRGPIAGYSAKERVESAVERIERALAEERDPAVTTEENADGTRVMLGGKPAFLVTKVDIDEQIGETTQNVAREAGKRLQYAIGQQREHETPRYLAMAATFSTVSTVLYALVLWLIWRVNGWVGGRLAASAARSQAIQVSGVSLLDAAHVLIYTRRLILFVAWLLAIALTVGWLTYILDQFPFTRPWGEGLEGNLSRIAKDIALAMIGAIPGLIFVGIIYLIARGISRVAEVFFRRVESGRVHVGWLDADTSRPTRRIFNIVLFVFALAMAYPYLPGAQTEAFKGLSVLVGLMISIGATSVVGQAFNGLILMYTRAFRRGDYVRIGDNEGTVIELGMFITRIRTGLGEEIALPNSTVMATSTRNYSRAVPGTGFIVDTVVTINYATPWRQVHAILEEAASRTPGVAKTPPPMVRQTAFADFYTEYRLIAYTPVEDPMQRADVLNQLHGNIQDVFNEHGVPMLSTHYMMDPKEPHTVPRDRWYAAPARPPEGQEGK